MGDQVEFLSPGLEGKMFEIDSMQDSDGFPVNSARNEETIFLQVPPGVRPNDLIRRPKDLNADNKTVSALAGGTQC
jgi:U32 family peptidase